MTRRERVIRALKHEETDFIPYNIDFTHQQLYKMQQFTGNQDFMECVGNLKLDWMFIRPSNQKYMTSEKLRRNLGATLRFGVE